MAKSAPKHFFSKLASIQMPRSVFNFDNTDTCTFKSDYLYPNYDMTVLPGDTVSMSYSNLTRFLPAIDVPMMDNVHCTVDFWFVPWRLVWEDTKYFFGEQQRSNPITSYTIPKITFASGEYPTSGSIYDYFNIPIQGTDSQYTTEPTQIINALKFRSYNLIYDEWYRDEQRCPYAYYNVSSTNDASTDFVLLKRGKRFDYFTSTLLEPQIGDPISLSLQSNAPVYGTGQPMQLTYLSSGGSAGSGIGSMGIYSSSSTPRLGFAQNVYTALNTSGSTAQLPGANGYVAGLISKDQEAILNSGSPAVPVDSGLYADLSQATAIQISQLRMAFQLQAYNEIRAKAGVRFTEYIYGQYGVISPDARLQRPEYLGGCNFPISVQPIVQTSGTYTSGSSATTPQGTITGYMIGGTTDNFVFSKSFTEFGHIIGIINYYADLSYYQGIDRFDYISDVLEIPVPVLANLTDEQVDRKEIYFTGDSSVDDLAFGYQERFGFAKYKKNTLRGLVRPNAPQSIGFWSLAQQFNSSLVNDQTFIESNTPMSRISAVTNEDNFIANQKFKTTVIRELPQYSDPMKWFMRG